MSLHIENLVAAVVGPLFANGVWAGRAPDGQPQPYVTFTHDGQTEMYLSGPAQMQNTLVDLNVWADTAEACEALADQVMTLMLAQNMDASPTSFTATPKRQMLAPPDPTVKLQRVVMEFSLWYRP